MYIIIAVNFHAVSTHNLAVCQHLRELKRRHDHAEQATVHVPTDCNNDESAGNELKVRRTLTIDYQLNRMKRRIQTILPSISIWIFATSMALPHVLYTERTINSCCSLSLYISHLETLPFVAMIVFQLAIPILCFICGIFLLGVKLITFQLDLKMCKLAEDVKEILVFALILTLSYILISLLGYSLKFLAGLEVPTSTYAKFLNITHSFMPTIRPFIYLTTLKHLRKSIMMFFIQ